jgi:AraC family ethanolamine operon transcriptional activator
VEYATNRRYQQVTLAELCAVAGVSERRLRNAFYDVYGSAPTVELRRRALVEARTELVAGLSARDAVTRVATDLGFGHLSRFAGQYRAEFGESPSATVRRAMR